MHHKEAVALRTGGAGLMSTLVKHCSTQTSVLSFASRCWDLVLDLRLLLCGRPEKPSPTGKKSWSWRLSSWRWSSATRLKKTSRKPAGNPHKQVRARVQRPQGQGSTQVLAVCVCWELMKLKFSFYTQLPSLVTGEQPHRSNYPRTLYRSRGNGTS